MRTWFLSRSYAIINPDTSGSIIQCSIPTCLPTTGRRSALKWIVIIVLSIIASQRMWEDADFIILHVDSPSLLIFRVSLTRLLAPSQAMTWRLSSSYVFFAPRSSITVVTWSPCYSACQSMSQRQGNTTYLFTANKWVILPDLHQSVLGKSLSNELFKRRLRNIVDHLSKPGQLKNC